MSERSQALFPHSRSIIWATSGELYREIFDRLTPGGFFLRDDIVAPPPALKPKRDRLKLLTKDGAVLRDLGTERANLFANRADFREQFGTCASSAWTFNNFARLLKRSEPLE